jgi:hypothetical protein
MVPETTYKAQQPPQLEGTVVLRKKSYIHTSTITHILSVQPGILDNKHKSNPEDCSTKMASALALNAIFGIQEIGNLVKHFDFSKVISCPIC